MRDADVLLDAALYDMKPLRVKNQQPAQYGLVKRNVHTCVGLNALPIRLGTVKDHFHSHHAMMSHSRLSLRAQSGCTLAEILL